MSEKKLVVLFPGGNYSTDCPLLYYAGFKYEVLGYEKLVISYENLLKPDKSLDECIKDIENAVLIQLQAIDFSIYSDIVFASKSLGTVIAGWIGTKLNINARHIYLTPIKETLPFIQADKKIIIVIAGTKDRHLNYEILKEHCIKENICLKLFDGVGHRLEVWGGYE